MGEHYANVSRNNTSSRTGGLFRFWESRPEVPLTSTSFLEYAGAGLGIAGWLGVRQIGSTGAQQIGFLVWIAGGLILIAWGYRSKARGIMLINGVNVVMAASAFVALA